MPVMLRNVGKEEPEGALCHVLRYYTTGICIDFFSFFVCFLNNKRILMPHIDYMLYVQTKGKL